MARASGSTPVENDDASTQRSALAPSDEANERFAQTFSEYLDDAALPPDHQNFRPFAIQSQDGSAWLQVNSVHGTCEYEGGLDLGAIAGSTLNAKVTNEESGAQCVVELKDPFAICTLHESGKVSIEATSTHNIGCAVANIRHLLSDLGLKKVEMCSEHKIERISSSGFLGFSLNRFRFGRAWGSQSRVADNVKYDMKVPAHPTEQKINCAIYFSGKIDLEGGNTMNQHEWALNKLVNNLSSFRTVRAYT